ncbi:DNase I-like protein [Scleroderma citrinum]
MIHPIVYPVHLAKVFDLREKTIALHQRLSPSVAGLPGNDLADISLVRDEWIHKSATAMAVKGKMERLRLRVGSFNVNGKIPSQDLSPWIRAASGQTSWISPLKPLSPLDLYPSLLPEADEELDISASSLKNLVDMRDIDPDIFVLGFQEIDLSTEALLYATSSAKEEMWLTAIIAALGEKGVLYEKLASTQLVGMLLIVVVKKVLYSCFTDVRLCDAGAGIMGFMGNKGAIAIRFQFTLGPSADLEAESTRPITLTFVNSHLAAFDEMMERRNYDFHDLSARLTFPSAGNTGHGDVFNIYQCDALFWMVNLNYRIDLSDADIRAILTPHVDDNGGIRYLVVYDQLRKAIQSGKAFSGFLEHSITHLPTYRYAVGISRDPLGYDFKRKPAWTDRILHLPSPDIDLKQLAYRSHPEISLSDHQPISADFDVSFETVDEAEYEKHASELRRELSGFEESSHIPRIRLQQMNIDFGRIFYKHPTRQKLVLQNDGDIPCVFRFVGTTPNGPVAPPWLRVEPMVGLLRPQETATITVIAYVDNGAASELNLGPPRLECTLILHIALGKDYFIAVNGDYQYTCFANTLERLARMPGPVRKLQSPDDLVPTKRAANAPREIIRLINWVMTNALDTGTLFEHPPDEKLCAIIRECLDTGDEFPSTTAECDLPRIAAAVIATLVAFLDSLVQPVVPPYLHAMCLQVNDKEAAFEIPLRRRDSDSLEVWISLTACLHYISQHATVDRDAPLTSKSKAYRLAMVFAPILLRDDPSGTVPAMSPIGKRDFLLYFIG